MAEKALGQFLVKEGIIDDSNLARAFQRVNARGSSLVAHLVEMGVVDEYSVASAVAQACRLECMELATAEPPSHEAIGAVPPDFAREHRCVPLWVNDGVLVIGVANPLDLDIEADLRRHTGFPIKRVVVRDSAIRALLEQLYASNVVDGLYARLLGSADEDTPLQLVKAMLADAIQVGGDIHLMPSEGQWQACLCIDDAVEELFALSPTLYIAISQIFKGFLPPNLQDGGEFRIRTSGNEEVTFFLDVDSDHHGEQLFVCLLEREQIREPNDITVDFEFPQELAAELERTARDGNMCIGSLIQKAWTLTRDVINTACVCPYTAPRQEKQAMRVRMSKETLSDIDRAATANDRSRDWVVMKVLLMARECLLKGSKSNVA